MLFKIANELFRSGHFYEAALAYNYLNDIEPGFEIYKRSLNVALQQFAGRNGNRVPKLRWKNEARENYLLKVADGVVRHFHDKSPPYVNLALEMAAQHPERPLLAANAWRQTDPEQWMGQVNQWWSKHGLRAARLERSEDVTLQPFEQIRFSQQRAASGPLVTVIMSCFNAAKTLAIAIESVLNQDYRNLELLIFDDNSTDESQSVIRAFSEKDSRIRVFFNEKNVGTYSNRNRGLEEGMGEFVTVMDADDLCHPQRLTIQVDALRETPQAVAVIADWVRVTFDGCIVYKNGAAGGYQHEAVATLMFRRQLVIDRMGFYDRVRFGADTEYMHRIIRIFGDRGIKHLNMALVLASSHQYSLTGNTQYGVDGIFGSSVIRRDYKKAWQAWHESHAQPYIPADPASRPFEASAQMLNPA